MNPPTFYGEEKSLQVDKPKAKVALNEKLAFILDENMMKGHLTSSVLSKHINAANLFVNQRARCF